MERDEKYREIVEDLELSVEENVDEAMIVDILLEFEEFLSDGFSYYAPEGNVRGLLFLIARRIVEEFGGEE